MSLLMEALRKAEEAKSKASKEQQEHKEQDGSGAVPPESSSTEPVADNSPAENLHADSVSDSDQEPKPEVIHPEPVPAFDEIEPEDEEESPGSVPTLELEPYEAREEPAKEKDESDEIEHIDFANEVGQDSGSAQEHAPELHEHLDTEEDDDELSLFQSTYFRGKQNKGITEKEDHSDFELEDFEHDHTDSQHQDQTPPQEEKPEVSTFQTFEEFQPESASAVHTSQELKEPASVESGANDGAGTNTTGTDRPTEEDKAREKEIRSTAGSLFLAKQESQQRRVKRLLAIAAMLLVIPVAGGMYWFYTSMTSTPQMGFNIAAGGDIVNREFLGEQTQPADADATSPPADTGDLLASVESTVTETPQTGTPGETAQAGTQLAEATAVSEATDSGAALEVGAATPEPAPTAVVEDNPPVADNTPAAPAVQQPAQNQVVLNNQPAANQQDSLPSANNQGLNFVRTEVLNVINPDLSAAYDSYQRGDFTIAGRLYQQVLNSEPNNRDAMLGLASVYLKQNNIPLSQGLYARLLELNPRDPIARAGLLDSMRDDAVRQEAGLKSLIAQFPDVAPLSFALGNLYATQKRWSDAQNAYFDALLTAKSTNSGNISPDYAFNLAVSLERVNQPRAALDYYREAEAFSRNAVPSFDPALLRQRLNILEQQIR